MPFHLARHLHRALLVAEAGQDVDQLAEEEIAGSEQEVEKHPHYDGDAQEGLGAPECRLLQAGLLHLDGLGAPLCPAIDFSIWSAVRLICSMGRRSNRSLPSKRLTLAGALDIQSAAGPVRP